MIDLHVHSTCSDGTLSPKELAASADEYGIHAVALTDHDTVDGVEEFLDACAPTSVLGIAGVEISIDYGPGTFHLLGYHVDPAHQPLRYKLRWISEERDRRNTRILRRLCELGLPLTEADVMAEVPPDNVNIGRPHVAAAMVRKGHVRDVREAFARYLAKGKPAYVDRGKLGPGDGIALIRAAGGVPVLAHPFTLEGVGGPPLDALVRDWVGLGLQGIECIYPEHGDARTTRYTALARANRLIVTGGTDFHGETRPGIRIGMGGGGFVVPDRLVSDLNHRVGEENAETLKNSP